MSAILVKMPPAIRRAAAPRLSPTANPMKQDPAYSAGRNSKMHSIRNNSTLMSIMPMLMPAFSGIAYTGYGSPLRLANAVRELAKVFTRMPNQATP